MAYVTSFPDQSPWTGGGNDSNWAGYTVRMLMPASALSVSANANTKLYIAGAAGADLDVVKMYVGHGRTVGGNVYDFAAAPVQVLFSGSATVQAPAGSNVLSDAIAFAYDETKPMLVSLYVGVAGKDLLRWLPFTGAQLYTLSATDDAATQSTSGYSAYTADRHFFVQQVLVDAVDALMGQAVM